MMKNLLLGTTLSVATVFSALPAFAQPSSPGSRPDSESAVEREGRGHRGHGRHHRRGHGHRNPERRIERMTEELGLSQQQVRRIRSIFEDAKEEHRGIARGPEHREAHRAIFERTKQRVDAVLSPAQRAELEALREERRERLQNRRGRGHGHGDCERGGAEGRRGA
jgi:periplasmic protein CpxP/Spy